MRHSLLNTTQSRCSEAVLPFHSGSSSNINPLCPKGSLFDEYNRLALVREGKIYKSLLGCQGLREVIFGKRKQVCVTSSFYVHLLNTLFLFFFWGGGGRIMGGAQDRLALLSWREDRWSEMTEY